MKHDPPRNEPPAPAIAARAGSAVASRNLYGIDSGIALDDRRVLVVDESRFNQKTLARFLRWAGIRQVAFAGSGREALDMVESFAPDLVLLDIMLPDMDGIAVCEHLRGKESQADLSILVQTVVTSDIVRTNCFRAGANDVLNKPLNPGECIARVRYHLERRSIMQELRGFRERVEKDLRMAQAMQVGIAPEEEAIRALAETHGLDIAVHFQPCNEIGGDFWTMFEIDRTRLGVFIADFSGHGIPAAINTFRLHTLITRSDIRTLIGDPAAMLNQLSRELLEVLPIGHFATALYGIIDTAADTLTYAAAGSTNPVIGDSTRIRLLDGSGVFLGICDEEVYDTIVEPFPPGSFLFFYSDAVIEGRSAAGVMLGEAGLLDLIARYRHSEMGPLIPLVTDVLKASGMQVQDDLTAIWIARP